MMEALIQAHHNLGGLSAPVIHIAGSKGKGTTATLIAKILEWSGKKVGLFTSPPLLSNEEMIQINSEAIGSEALEIHLKRVDSVSSTNFTEFERLTLAALLHFQKEKCDFVVLECGWGGTKDATNIVENKILTILTHVELEHTEVLGRTLTEITREKLGITRPGILLLTVPTQNPEVFAEIRRWELSPVLVTAQECGNHHPESVGLALQAAQELGIPVSVALLNQLEELLIPGRFEIFSWNMHTILLDGAHTFDSVHYVQERVLQTVKSKGLATPLWAIHFLKDKAKDLWTLFPKNKTVWIALNDPRAGAAPKDSPVATVADVFEELKQEEIPRFVVFMGSFRLVAAVKRFLIS